MFQMKKALQEEILSDWLQSVSFSSLYLIFKKNGLKGMNVANNKLVKI